MDFACSFPGSRASISAGSKWRFRRRLLYRNCLSESRVSCKAGLTYQSNKIESIMMIPVSGCAALKSDFGKKIRSSRLVVRVKCQPNDYLAYVDGNGRNFKVAESTLEDRESSSSEGLTMVSASDAETNGSEAEGDADKNDPRVEDLKELLQKALKELEVAQLNSTMFEEKAQQISESAIALKDEADNAWNDVTSAVSAIQVIIEEEAVAKEAVQKATMALSMAEARLQLAVKALDSTKGDVVSLEASMQSDFNDEGSSPPLDSSEEEDESLLNAQDDIHDCRAMLENCEAELRHLQSRKAELQKEVDRLSEAAEEAQLNALKAEEDVANIMLLAEQAVAFQLEATQCVNDAEIALQRAEKLAANVETSETSALPQPPSSQAQILSDESGDEEEKVGDEVVADVGSNGEVLAGDGLSGSEASLDLTMDAITLGIEELSLSDHEQENGKLSVDSNREAADAEAEKSKTAFQTKKQEMQKDLTKDGSPLNAPKTLLKKSSRFFSASFFSFEVDGAEFTPASFFSGLIAAARKHMPKLVLSVFLLGAG